MKYFCFILSLLSITAKGQDFEKQARELQQTYKDSEAATIQELSEYEFIKDAKVAARIVETTNKKLLSLRYNSSVFLVETYDNNSQVDKFFADSNKKQHAPNGTQICGKYTSEGLFYDDSKFCTHVLKLKEIGEVWDVNTVKKINDGKYLTSIFFQEKFPVLEKKIRLLIPSTVEVEIKEFNFKGFSITKQEHTDGDIKTVEYTATNLVPLTSEKFDRGMQYNHPHVLILVKSALVGGKKITSLASTDDLYALYHSLTAQLTPNSKAFSQIVDHLIADKKTDEDKIKAIYYWVQDNIRYIAFEDGVAAFKPDEAHQVFEKRYGDCKGMANLTKEMLKYAGYDARLTWIGTKRIMYDQTLPSLAVNNHMICTVLLNGKKYYLDATEKYMPFGENAERIQNRSVMIEDGNKYMLDKVQGMDVNHDLETRTIKAKIDNEEIVGDCKINLTGEPKKNFLYLYHNTKSDKKTEYINDYLTGNNSAIKTSNLVLPDFEERNGALTLTCGFTNAKAITAFNNEYYIDIDPAKTFRNWTLKETRQNDIDFGEKMHKKSVIELEIPNGFSVTSVPENLKIVDPAFSFSIDYKVDGKKIVYTKEMIVPKGIIEKTSFPQWNDAIKKLDKAYEDQIILKK